ncbi:reverse transcriptase domain-containing protein [Tanacetum coccineum]
MRTRSSSNLIAESSTTPKRRNRRRSKQRVKPFSLEETLGYEDAIVILAILAENFELKHGLLNLVTSKQFYRFEKEDPHAHICWFNKITTTIKYRDLPNSSIKLMLFPFSVEGAAQIWLKKEPPHSILTWEDLVSKFINQFFPLSKTTNLRNEITNFQQRFDESFCEAWDRFKDLLHACPHHGFLKLHQLDTFYNALTPTDQDSLNAAAGGNLLTKTPRDALTIIENKSKVRNSRNKPIVSKVSTNAPSSSTPHSPEIAALVDAVKAMLAQKSSPPASVKAVEEICVTCGGPHPYHQCLATDGNVFPEYRDNIQGYVSAAAVNYNQGNTGYRPQSVANQIRPPGFAQPNVQNNQTRYNQGYNQNRGNNQGNPNYQAPIQQTQVAPSNELSNYKKINDANMKAMQNQINNVKNELRNEMQTSIQTSMSNQTNELKNMMATSPRVVISYDGPPIPPLCQGGGTGTRGDKGYGATENTFQARSADALLHMLKFASMFKSLLNNKEKLFDLAKTPIVECLALADRGASINLMPLSIWKKLSLPELTPTQMILELADRSTTRWSALIDVYGEELTLRVDDEAITFKYAQEVLGFSDSSTSGNPTPSLDPILSTSFPSLTPFKGGDIILEEIEACLSNDSIPLGIGDADFDLEGDIRLLEELLNNDPSYPLPLKELHFEEIKTFKSSIDDPPELELKDLPSHLECMMAIFHDMIEETMEVFMDDFSVFGDSFSSCLSHLDKMLKRCEDTNLVLNWEKCHFMVKEGIVLGHKISKSGIEVDKAKVDVIAKLPHPTSVKGIRSFLGHAGFYRRFIQDFSKIARPMTHLLEKDTPFIFSKECVESFNILKKKLTEAPILVAPDWDLPFKIMCDASDYAVGAVLGQRKTKHFQPIHYASKTMTDAQAHYTTTEKELLAVVYAFEKFRPYLVLSKTIVYTDHSTLKYLLAKQDVKPPPNDSTGCVTLFVGWIEDCPLTDGLKMPSHVGSYDKKRDPNNYLHIFEGAIRMQKWAIPVACHMFTYTLKDSAPMVGWTKSR